MTLIPVFKKTILDSRSQDMYIPKKIATHIVALEGRDFKLRNARGFTWDINIEFFEHSITQARFCGDWSGFLFDNYIKDDFIVLFFNNEPYIFDVVVLDGKGVASCEFCGENRKMKLEGPYFDVNVTKTVKEHGRISIPKAFWNDHILPRGLIDEHNATIHGPADLRYVVQVVEHSDGRHFFSHGCKEIIDDLQIPLNTNLRMKLLNVPHLVFAFGLL